MTQLNSKFSMKELGPLSYFLSISITRHIWGLFYHKRNMWRKSLSVWVCLLANHLIYRWTHTTKLSDSSRNLYHEHPKYCSLVGSLKYLTLTRPSITCVVQQVCLFMHDPKTQHKCIIRYIHGTLNSYIYIIPSIINTYILMQTVVDVQTPEGPHLGIVYILGIILSLEYHGVANVVYLSHVGLGIFFWNYVAMSRTRH